MKWTLLVLALMLGGLALLAWTRGEFAAGLRTAGTMGLKFAPILVIAFALMGFIEVLLPERLVEDWLSDSSGWRGLGIAWLAGVLTPAGSVTGLPVAASLHSAGVGPAILVTYLTSMATLSLIRVPLEVGFYGWSLTGMRVLACLILPFIAGLITRAVAPLLSG